MINAAQMLQISNVEYSMNVCLEHIHYDSNNTVSTMSCIQRLVSVLLLNSI